MTLAEAWAVIDQLMSIMAALQARVAELEQRLGQNSQNSSRPPSSDSPAVNRMKERAPSGRKPGGQPGHEGHQRMMLPDDQVDEVVAVKPTRCRRCHERLHGADAQPHRHQVIELPEQRPHVTEYRLHTLQCASCGLTTTAPLPAEVPRGMFGPRLQATIAMCTGVYHLSRRTTVQLLADLFHVELALGSISATERAVSDAVAGPVQEARQYVQEQAVVHADETGWRQERQRAWLWVMLSALVTVFVVQGRRGSEAARALLGTCSAILVTDRYGAYRQWAVEGRLCNRVRIPAIVNTEIAPS